MSNFYFLYSTFCLALRFKIMRLQTTKGDNYPDILQLIINLLYHLSNNFCKEVLYPQGEKSQLWEIF